MDHDLIERLRDHRRLAALRASALVELAPPSVVLELCELLRTVLGVDAAAVTLVDVDRQFFVATSGLPEPWASQGETDLDHCMCQQVVARGTTVAIEDVEEIDLRDGSLAPELGIGAYLGHPLFGPGGEVLGATCAIRSMPAPWSDHDRRVLETIGRTVNHVLLAASATPPPPASDEMAMVAHDLRSPLTVLVGASRHLAQADEPEQMRSELTAMVERASAQLEALVDDLLRTAQPADAVRSLAREPVDLATLVRELAHHASITHHVEVQVRAEDPVTIWSDAGALQRVVQNLLDNAVRHGAPPFEIDLVKTSTGVRIAMANHGPAIDDAARMQLFGRFRPGTGSTSRTGLGLHIVWRLVNALGGTVEVLDRDGATVFEVDLPQRQR